MQRERDAAPEPKDKLSAEWRHWKLRRFRLAFTSGDAAQYAAAWDEYRLLLNSLVAVEEFWRADYALALLPQFIICRQEIDESARHERRMTAGMKGAQTRKARAAAGKA